MHLPVYHTGNAMHCNVKQCEKYQQTLNMNVFSFSVAVLGFSFLLGGGGTGVVTLSSEGTQLILSC